MVNINAFWPVVHHRRFLNIYQNFLIVPLIEPQKGPAPILELPSLVKLGLVVLPDKFI